MCDKSRPFQLVPLSAFLVHMTSLLSTALSNWTKRCYHLTHSKLMVMVIKLRIQMHTYLYTPTYLQKSNFFFTYSQHLNMLHERTITTTQTIVNVDATAYKSNNRKQSLSRMLVVLLINLTARAPPTFFIFFLQIGLRRELFQSWNKNPT